MTLDIAVIISFIKHFIWSISQRYIKIHRDHKITSTTTTTTNIPAIRIFRTVETIFFTPHSIVEEFQLKVL